MGLFSNIFGTPLSTPVSGTNSSRRTEGATGKDRIVLSKGEVVKGEVTDLRSNEVTVRLEDGRTLHAKLSSAAELAIGQESEFLVQDSNESLITLKILSDQDSSFAESAIDKALEAAGLPKSQNAADIVRSLLTAGLPANKDMIQQMLRYSAANKEVDLSTLTALIKNKIPVTKENATELQAYRNFEHRLVSQAASMTEAFTDALRFGETSEDFAAKLLNAFFGDGVEAADSAVTSETTPAMATTTAPVDSELLSAPPKEATEPISKEALSLAQSTTEQIGELLADTTELVSAGPNQTETQNAATNAVKASATDSSRAPLRDIDAPLSSLLSENEWKAVETALTGYAVSNPEDASLASLAANPNLSAKELFSTLSAHGKEHPSSLAPLLRNSPELTDLLEKTMLSDFVMSPQDLEKEDFVKSFYEQLNRTLSKLKSLSEDSSSASLKTAVDTAGKMQDNLHFMNTLNQVFPYVQLPLKMTEQLTHGELYVYTKKKDLSAQDHEVSILLHLDMDSLGPTDIHVSMLRQTVGAKFYLTDESSMPIVEENMSLLTNALSKKGYILNAQVMKREKEPDIVNDFLNDSEATPMKRFRFDIRA